MATLYSGSVSKPVKVRDLSIGGALIECGDLPAIGTSVKMSRGSLTVTGRVVWCRDGRGGLCFDSPIVVPEWLPGGRVTAPQQRVDEIIRLVKFSDPRAARPRDQAIQPRKRSAQELMQLQSAVNSLAEDLAGDAELVNRHIEKLQVLDEVVHVLREFAAKG